MLENGIKMVERFQREVIGADIPERPTALPSKRIKALRTHITEELDELAGGHLGDPRAARAAAE